MLFGPTLVSRPLLGSRMFTTLPVTTAVNELNNATNTASENIVSAELRDRIDNPSAEHATQLKQ